MNTFKLVRTPWGFTMLELVAVLTIGSVLAAVATPSFLTLIRQRELLSAVTDVEGALREAQRQAMRDSTTCRVVINADNVVTQCPVGTQLRLTNLSDSVQATTDFGANSVDFTFRGTTANTGTVTLNSDNANVGDRCVVVSSLLGKVRSGTVDGLNCVTQ